jgi:hypothetical protein
LQVAEPGRSRNAQLTRWDSLLGKSQAAGSGRPSRLRASPAQLKGVGTSQQGVPLSGVFRKHVRCRWLTLARAAMKAQKVEEAAAKAVRRLGLAGLAAYAPPQLAGAGRPALGAGPRPVLANVAKGADASQLVSGGWSRYERYRCRPSGVLAA